jgi:hypothetical protein
MDCVLLSVFDIKRFTSLSLTPLHTPSTPPPPKTSPHLPRERRAPPHALKQRVLPPVQLGAHRVAQRLGRHVIQVCEDVGALRVADELGDAALEDLDEGWGG